VQDSASAQTERDSAASSASSIEPTLPTLAPASPDNTLNGAVTTSAPGEPSIIEVELKFRIRLPDWLARLLKHEHTPITRIYGSTWAARDVEQPAVILTAVVAGAIGQVLVLEHQINWGIAAYVAAVLLVIVWARSHPASRDRLTNIASLSRRVEIWLVILIIALAAFARYYHLDQRMYGVDGDEKSWTLQSYFSVLRNERRGEFVDRHFHFQPITFYLEGWAMRLFGINLLTPRYLNATMSLLTLLLFYLLMKRAVGPPGALVGTVLAAFAFVELSASRQAIHDTLVEPWVLFAYFALIEAVEARKTQWFFAAGIAAAVGMLTYETFYLTPIVALAYLLVCTARDRKNWQDWGKFIIAFLLPLALVLPSTSEYIRTRQAYHLSSLSNGSEPTVFVMTRLGESVSTLFSAVKYTDQLVRWGEGPIINPWILPLAVIGMIYALMTWRKSHAVLLALWFVIQYFPFGALGAPLPRVFYPALMAVSGLGAVGVIIALKAVRQSLPRANSLTLIGGVVFFLVLAVLYDVDVFANRLVDMDEQQKRRELADLVRVSASTAPMTYLPYVPFAGDVAEVEQNLVEFSVAGVRGLKNPTGYYTLVELNQLLAHLWDDHRLYPKVNLILDKTAFNDPNQEQRSVFEFALRGCYPQSQVEPGRYFDLYQLATEDLKNPACYSTNAFTAVRPEKNAALADTLPITFEWRVLGASPQTYRLVVERQNPQLIWLEAEQSFSRDKGWFDEARFAANYSGIGYLADEWHAGPAVAVLNIAQADKYKLWARTYRRSVDDQHTFIAMNADAPVEIATAQMPMNTWVWQPLGDYVLQPGRQAITLTRTYGADPHRSIFVDALVLSSDPAFDPASHTPWAVVTDTGQQPMTTSYSLTRGLAPGLYRWRVEVYDGNRLVNGSGQPGVSTQAREFVVTPVDNATQ